MDLEHVAGLQQLIAEEAHNRITLDMKEITIADRETVSYLMEAEATGIRVINCPEYVRSWIAAEKIIGAEAP